MSVIRVSEAKNYKEYFLFSDPLLVGCQTKLRRLETSINCQEYTDIDYRQYQI